MYAIAGSYGITADYDDWSDPALVAPTISSEHLLGGAACPNCAHRFGFAICRCGGVHCVSGDGEATCPWCGDVGFYTSGGDDEPGTEVQRGRG